MLSGGPDQLGKADPLTDQSGVRSLANCGVELSVDSANVRTLSPATDEPESTSPFVAVGLRMHFQKNTWMLWVCKRRASAIRCCRVCGGFHMVTSAAVSGQGGVKILVRKSLCGASDIFVLRATAGILVDSCFNAEVPHSWFARPMRAVRLREETSAMEWWMAAW